ncbi:MAG TPA: patatin-like phospholipase family protein [Novosphingobium sp.]|nr:patatin-like phospholipase family protein [Novosphingobium sp.]
MTDPIAPDSSDTLATFTQVEQAEWAKVRQRRQTLGLPVGGPLGRPDSLVGLALSGGGIRSAAVCLGAIQALQNQNWLRAFDYLSTVSGGGYTGACLTAAMATSGGASGGATSVVPADDEMRYPFGNGLNDSSVLKHIRNYSNYLLPRAHSAIRNWSEALVVLMRGLLANAVCVAAFVLPAAWLTWLAFPGATTPRDANFLLHLLGVLPPDKSYHAMPFMLTGGLGVLLAVALLVWAMARSFSINDRLSGDADGLLLKVSRWLLIAMAVMALLDVQPLALAWLGGDHKATQMVEHNKSWWALASALGAGVASVAGKIDAFLKSMERLNGWWPMLLRLTTQGALVVVALILPGLVWLSYLLVTLALVKGKGLASRQVFAHTIPDLPLSANLWWMILLCWAVMLCLRPNGYTLHRFYRDRLARAFLVQTVPDPQRPAPRRPAGFGALRDLPLRPDIPLSSLADTSGPYPLINAALNVQGSRRANQRGRNADFFLFSPLFTGSYLTGYAPTPRIEAIDPRINLATAMAISGAAASANMGSATVRLLSPTLALLNIRLGYYMTNPLHAFGAGRLGSYLWRTFSARFFLLNEMTNNLTETDRTVYLTDGGHVENLGIYELLRRRCKLIVAIDAEADPALACAALLRVERYARIDLGVRLVVPWEEIHRRSHVTSTALAAEGAAGTNPRQHGPHIAAGTILYPECRDANGSLLPAESGTIVYVKASLSGDEKDYVLDYAARYPAFPHENTSDQFFSEEQFEMYRSLGYHMISGLAGQDDIAIPSDPPVGFESPAQAREAIKRLLGGQPEQA